MTIVKRLSIDAMYMQINQLVSQRSTCLRAKVGAVLVIDGRPISIGYNGSISGQPHCIDKGCDIYKGNCRRVVHAEANSIAFAAKHGIKTDGATIYCSYAPCANCARLIIQSGIKKVVYRYPYHDSDLKVIEQAKIEIVKYGD